VVEFSHVGTADAVDDALILQTQHLALIVGHQCTPDMLTEHFLDHFVSQVISLQVFPVENDSFVTITLFIAVNGVSLL